jgi:hypothetical protein
VDAELRVRQKVLVRDARRGQGVEVGMLRALRGGVEFGAAAGVLVYVLAYRVPSHKAEGEGRVAERLSRFPASELETVGDAAPGNR